MQKRRIYDITNVLEGIGLIEKKLKNRIQWKYGQMFMDLMNIVFIFPKLFFPEVNRENKKLLILAHWSGVLMYQNQGRLTRVLLACRFVEINDFLGASVPKIFVFYIELLRCYLSLLETHVLPLLWTLKISSIISSYCISNITVKV